MYRFGFVVYFFTLVEKIIQMLPTVPREDSVQNTNVVWLFVRDVQ